MSTEPKKPSSRIVLYAVLIGLFVTAALGIRRLPESEKEEPEPPASSRSLAATQAEPVVVSLERVPITAPVAPAWSEWVPVHSGYQNFYCVPVDDDPDGKCQTYETPPYRRQCKKSDGSEHAWESGKCTNGVASRVQAVGTEALKMRRWYRPE